MRESFNQLSFRIRRSPCFDLFPLISCFARLASLSPPRFFSSLPLLLSLPFPSLSSPAESSSPRSTFLPLSFDFRKDYSINNTLLSSTFDSFHPSPRHRLPSSSTTSPIETSKQTCELHFPPFHSQHSSSPPQESTHSLLLDVSLSKSIYPLPKTPALHLPSLLLHLQILHLRMRDSLFPFTTDEAQKN